jgi:hypothetical protein
LPERSVLTCDWVTDGEESGTTHVIVGENEEAVAGGLGIRGAVKLGDALKLSVDSLVI